MDRPQIIARLKANEPALRARGVDHVALFGSRARGDDLPDSDSDIMIKLDPSQHISIFGYAGLRDYIAGLFDEPVDVVSRANLKPYIRPAAIVDAVSRNHLRSLATTASSAERRHPEIAWRAIAGAGNIYRHDYEDVAAGHVWTPFSMICHL